jgi:4-hydroxy-2-oxoheptanedioate aldolase
VLRANRLKRKLKAGEKAFGCWVFMAGGDSTELLSLCGYDALIVDHEHVGADLRTLIEQLRSAQASDATMLLRLPSHDPVYLKRALDAGLDGIIAPTVETAEQAHAIVDACRYRPQGGHRGVGYAGSRAAHWGLKETQYPQAFLDELLVCALVETRKGIENVAEIAQVDGVAMVIPGAGDLAADLVPDFASLGLYGAYQMPELDRLLGEAEKATKSAGKWLGGVARSSAGAKALLARGYDFVTPTADIWLLSDGAKVALEEVRCS